MKSCFKCNQVLPIQAFGLDKAKSDGHRGVCKACFNAKSRQLRIENLERYKSYQIKNRLKHPETQKFNNKKWAANNPERRKQINNEWAKNNRHYLAQRMVEYRKRKPTKHQEWVKANPEVARNNWQRRRAVEKNAPTFFITKKELLRLYASPCFYCGLKTDSMHMDHVMPISRGGRHSIGNLVPACAKCNISKKDKLLIEWRIYEKKRLAQITS